MIEARPEVGHPHVPRNGVVDFIATNLVTQGVGLGLLAPRLKIFSIRSR
jgi:hypothetical protein